MARQKQATPLRREHSSEYTVGTLSKLRSPFIEDGTEEVHEKVATLNKWHTNGTTTAPATLPPPAIRGPEEKQAGLLELVIGVSGIYASL